MFVAPDVSQPIDPGWELTSVVLEITAFFFVTVELYGEERLKTLNARISGILSGTLTTLRLRAGHEGPDKALALGTLSGFFAHYVGLLIMYGLLQLSLPKQPPVVGFIMSVGHGFVVFMAAVFALSIVIDVLMFMQAVVLWLLTKLKFKGLLLTFGTLLFVFAKGILIVHLLHELHFPLPWPLK